MSDAPRYRLVGYDIGTAPDENGGWVHWTDHEAIVARLTAERDAALAGAVKAKPLVWSDDYRPVASPQSYQIWPDNGGSGAPDDPIETFDGYMLYSPTMMALGVHPTPEAAQVSAQADYEARILAAIQPDPEGRQEALAKAWQPIETAPRGVEVGGNNAVSWMVLAWPDGEGGYHRNSGMMVGEKFYAAPAFYIGGWHGVKHYALREIEIFPTHWMPDPPPPADLAAKIGGE